MSIVADYSSDVLPMYGNFVIGDPYCDADEDDTRQAQTAADVHVIAATQYHAHLHTAQQVSKVSLHLRVWDASHRFHSKVIAAALGNISGRSPSNALRRS